MNSASPRHSLPERNIRYLQTLFLLKTYSDKDKEHSKELLKILNSSHNLSPENPQPQSFLDIYKQNLNAPIRNCKDYTNFVYERLDFGFDKIINSLVKFAFGICSIGAGCFLLMPSSKPEEPQSHLIVIDNSQTRQ